MSRKSRSKGTDPATPRTRKKLAQERLQTHTFPIFILVVATFIAYANAWPNNLVMDDVIFAAGSRPSSINLTEIGNFFTSDVWASIGLDTGLYRPLLLVSVALDIQLFGDWVAGYHLVNILLHTLVVVFVFGLVRYLLAITGGKPALVVTASLLAALVFAVHPVNTEVVNSIFNRSDILVSLGVAGGLWWFLPTVEERPVKAWIGLGFIYFYVLLCKETGVMLPALAVSALWLTSFDDWRTRLRKCIPVLWLLIPLGIYFLLRLNALESPAVADVVVSDSINQPEADSAIPSIGRLFSPAKVFPAFRVWFDSMGLLLWPHPLLAFRGGSETNQWLALTVQLGLLVSAFALYLRKSPWMLLGLLFFYIMIFPSSRIIGAGGFPHIAERYIYSPSLGLVILLAFGLYWLARRYSARWAVIVALTVTMIMTPLTWSRNADWASTLKLAEHDYNHGRKAGKTLNTLVSALLFKREFARASSICDRHRDAFSTQWYLSTICGQVYEKRKRYDKAENAFMLSLNSEEGKASGHLLLAGMYLKLDRRSDAEKQFEFAIVEEQQAFMKEYLKADALIQLYPSDSRKLLEARAHLEKALELQPRFNLARKQIVELDETLKRASR